MKNKKFESLWKVYRETKSAEDRLSIMKDFMLNSNLEELMAWNNYLGDMLEKSLKELVAKGLTDEDRAFFEEQFAKFDGLEAELKVRKAAFEIGKNKNSDDIEALPQVRKAA
jgi:hypothetical protein